MGKVRGPQELCFTLKSNRFSSLGHKPDHRIPLGECFFDLGADLEGEGVQALGEVADILQKLVVEDDGWDGDEKARGGGDERFRDARRYGAEAGGAGVAEAGKGVDDAPDGTEEADEGSNGASCGEPAIGRVDRPTLSELATERR